MQEKRAQMAEIWRMSAPSFFIWFISVLLSGIAATAQESRPELTVSFANGHVYVRPETNRAFLAAARIRRMYIWQLPEGDTARRKLLEETAFGKDGHPFLLNSDTRSTDSSELSFDDQGNITAHAFTTSAIVGCGTSGYGNVTTRFFTRHHYQQHRLTETITKYTTFGGTTIDSSKNSTTTATIRYNAHGDKSLETSQIQQPGDRTGIHNYGSGLQYVYDNKGRIYREVSLNDAQDTVPIGLLQRIPRNIANIIMRQSDEWSDSAIRRDFGHLLTDTSDDGEDDDADVYRLIYEREQADDSVIRLHHDHLRALTQYDYDSRGRLLTRSKTNGLHPSELPILDSFIYDKRGRMTVWQTRQIGVPAKDCAFTYNAKHQVIQARYVYYSGDGYLKPLGKANREMRYEFTYDRNGHVATMVWYREQNPKPEAVYQLGYDGW